MRDSREIWAKRRIRFAGGLFIVLFLAVVARTFYLQVIDSDRLQKLAERQHQRAVPLTPDRGTIYDRTGNPLAVSVEMDSCYAEPRAIKNPAATASKLAPLLQMSVAELQKKLTGSRGFVWLARRLTPETAQQVKGLGLEGIAFVKETKRFYPNAEIASHVLGFTGLDPSGLEGIELKFDSTIMGNTGYLVTERDALGRDIGLMKTVIKKASKGGNVHLTLDKNIQYIAEKELTKAVLSSGARAGMAFVMEPQTGKVLAIANYPTFNPNAHDKYSTNELRNRAVCDSFEPGSTFKVFLVAASLQEGIVSPSDGFNCENGSYAIGGRVIHDTHRYGYLKVADVLKYSSNIGAAKMGSRLGSERLFSYLRNFGFGERTGIELPGEATGYLRDRKQWFGVDLATISFGQGVSATVVQQCAAISAIANGGVVMKPYLVEKITSESGEVLQEFEPGVRRRVLSAEVSATVTRMMESVTGEGGTGTNAAVAGYRVAGKTGTAQKVDPLTRGYSVDKRTASFVGFVPADKPRLTIMVVIDEPKTSPYGGVVAAPAFREIAHQSLCYLKVAPEGGGKGAQPAVVQEEKPVDRRLLEVAAAEGTFVTGEEGSMMPDFRGMSMRQVLRSMEKRGLNIRLIGSGRAVEQSPQPGGRIGESGQVWVRFVPAA
jgi:cell division protein FtsI (penicillin-binding protein 3)